MLERCSSILAEARRLVRVEEKGRVPRYESAEALALAEKLKDCVVESVAGSRLEEALAWLEEAMGAVERAVVKLKLRGVSLPKELRSFAEDPRAHLRKKLFVYTLDLMRGLVSPEDYASKARSAVTTSLRTNMRSLYQTWGVSSILASLADRGFRLVYPEHGHLSLDRSGKQRLGSIPPNAILYGSRRGYLSIFLEAPRPLSWEDSSDLRRVWGLYTALRPDVMAYGGWVADMVDYSRSPPVRRPSVIIEFKELEEWWTRVRDLRGYLRKPLSAEEWASMWLEGLWDGLAEALGVGRAEAKRRAEEGGLRVREPRMLLLYKSTYKPDSMILVSRVRIPGEVRRELETEGVLVVDGVYFDSRALDQVAEALAEKASLEGSTTVTIELPPDLAAELEELSKATGLSVEELLREALMLFRNAMAEELLQAEEAA